MSEPKNPGVGGSYRVNDAGELEQVEAATRDHPDGNRPRDSEGRPLDGLTGRPIPPQENETEKPARRRVPAAAAASGD